MSDVTTKRHGKRRWAMKKGPEPFPLLMAQEFWMNSQLSVARFYGGCTLNGYRYDIVDESGRTLIELSLKGGPGKAIPAGKPADLVVADLVPAYKALGRDAIIALIEGGKNVREIKAAAKAERERKHAEAKRAKEQEQGQQKQLEL